MQATPEEFSRVTCCITIDGERICRWQWIRRTHDLCNHPSRGRCSRFRMSTVCIVITSGWRHDTGKPTTRQANVTNFREGQPVFRPQSYAKTLPFSTLLHMIGAWLLLTNIYTNNLPVAAPTFLPKKH